MISCLELVVEIKREHRMSYRKFQEWAQQVQNMLNAKKFGDIAFNDKDFTSAVDYYSKARKVDEAVQGKIVYFQRRKSKAQEIKYRGEMLNKVGKQRLREARIQAVDYLILLLARACLGSVTPFSDETFGAPGYTYTIVVVCKLNTTQQATLLLLYC